MSSIADAAVSIQTSEQSIPSTPSWFGAVTLIAHYLKRLGVLSTIEERVRFARSRFGHYDVIDFVAVLIGYALSGEATLEALDARLLPFAQPFMALFGRNRLPHRSTLSRFLAAIDPPTLEALRSLFQEDLAARPRPETSKGGPLGSSRKPLGRGGCRWHQAGRAATRLASDTRSARTPPTIGSGLCSGIFGTIAWRGGSHAHHGAASPYLSMVGIMWNRNRFVKGYQTGSSPVQQDAF